ncbi:hypothetical protein GGI12_001882 [Dipsacomyces acuminosporus]|nr:hypothetical protein GGI12_001882 [Dipsacomyces acuminosporus]
MHFSDLGADILCVIFSIIGKECNFYEDYGSSEEKEQNSEEYYTDDDYDSTERSNNYKQLVEASSHIRAKRSKSNVKFVIKSGNTNYVRSLSVKTVIGWMEEIPFIHMYLKMTEFSGHHAPELTYHNGDHTSKAEATKFRSDYYNDSKTSVCFPILENLQISYYPYKDESFYRLFEHCPLKLSSVNGVRYSQHGFPTQILANLERMSISVNLKHTGSLLTKKKSTETAVAQIMTSFSSAQIASLSSIPAITISLPKSIGWTFVKRLVDNDGNATIESYISNLHPSRHAALYPTIAKGFSRFVPMLEQVVTDLVHPRSQHEMTGDYK